MRGGVNPLVRWTRHREAEEHLSVLDEPLPTQNSSPTVTSREFIASQWTARGEKEQRRADL